MNYAALQNGVYDWLAGSRTVRRGALWTRNIATQLLAHRLAPSIHPEFNGEALLRRVLAPSLRVAIDVGANRGEWTAQLLEVAPAVETVICYEPGAVAVKMLHQRFQQEQRIMIVTAAVADAADERDFYEEANAGETSSLIGGHSDLLAVRRQVRVVTIDEELDRMQIGNVDLLKIDAEGMDLHVIRGADQALRDGRIAVAQFECGGAWAKAGSTLAAAFELLHGHNYEVFALLPSGLHHYDPERTGELFVYSNFVAVSREARSRLQPLVRSDAL